jgi:hypothetical protein
MGLGGQRHAPAALPPVPNVQEAAWAAGPIWTYAENLAPIGNRSPDPEVRSDLLYRLSYSDPLYCYYYKNKRMVL